jgi:hypothetical protein
MTTDSMELRRCTAKSKRSGQQCRRWAALGATVCVVHGGGSPQARRAAKARLAEAEAEFWPVMVRCP